MNCVYNWFGGKSTFFALLILTLVTVLQWRGSLTTQYIYALGIIQGLVAARAISQDWHTPSLPGTTTTTTTQTQGRSDTTVSNVAPDGGPASGSELS